MVLDRRDDKSNDPGEPEQSKPEPMGEPTIGKWLAKEGYDYTSYSALGVGEKQTLHDLYRAYLRKEGLEIPAEFDYTGLSGWYEGIAGETRAYEAYQRVGGTYSFEEWKTAGKPSGGGGGGEGSVVHQNADGYWVHDLNDTVWDSKADALTNYNSTVQSQGFSQELATSVEEYEADIERLGGEQAAEAKRLSARNVGKMSQDVRNALLAQGVDPGEIAQLSAGGIEGGQRSLNDLLQQMSLSTQQQLAGASQFGIGTQLTAESLAQAQTRMGTSQSQFGQSLAEQVRQFNQSQSQQASQFGQTLAQGNQQFGSTLDYNRWAQQGGWDVQNSQLANQVDQWGVQNKQSGWWGPQGPLGRFIGGG